MSERLPPLFIGHGSPINAIRENSYSSFLKKWARQNPAPKAIVVISAHWKTRGTFITANAHPEQIYDFYGFPDELYRIQYSPPGNPELAAEISKTIPEIHQHPTRGIDHAGWAVVKHMYPDQTIPLLELSLDATLTGQGHFDLGKKLESFSEKGVLLLGSGNIVHNLGETDFDEKSKPAQWAIDAESWVQSRIDSNKTEELISYQKNMPHWARAIPTDEHFLPLLYILGMKKDSGKSVTLFDEIQNGSISMKSIEIEPADSSTGAGQ